jgi:hypothetical protein
VQVTVEGMQFGMQMSLRAWRQVIRVTSSSGESGRK